MGAKSWVLTLTPLFIAIATTVKALLTGDSLTEQEVELIKYLFATFVGSGAIGAWLSAKKKSVAP